MNILLLAQGVIAESCLPSLKISENNGLVIKALATSNDFLKKAKPFLNQNIVFIDNRKRNETKLLRLIEEQSIEAIISIQHPWIISELLIQAVNGRTFNLHNAKLPDYKGHNSISHAILNNDKSYTTTVHWLAKEVDMGDIIFEETFEIENEDTAFSLYHKSIPKAVENFGKLIDCLVEKKDIPRKEIQGRGVFYRKNEIYRLKKIQDPKNLDEILTKYRAFYFPPHEPAYLEVDGARIYPQLDKSKYYNN